MFVESGEKIVCYKKMPRLQRAKTPLNDRRFFNYNEFRALRYFLNGVRLSRCKRVILL